MSNIKLQNLLLILLTLLIWFVLGDNIINYKIVQTANFQLSSSTLLIILLLTISLFLNKSRQIILFISTNNLTTELLSTFFIVTIIPIVQIVIFLHFGYYSIVLAIPTIVAEVIIINLYLLLRLIVKQIDIRTNIVYMKGVTLWLVLSFLVLSKGLFEPMGLTLDIFFQAGYLLFVLNIIVRLGSLVYNEIKIK
ncbi:MAG: hypothetical protein ACRCUP_07780 [Mycoplasmatales bacterium]